MKRLSMNSLVQCTCISVTSFWGAQEVEHVGMQTQKRLLCRLNGINVALLASHNLYCPTFYTLNCPRKLSQMRLVV